MTFRDRTLFPTQPGAFVFRDAEGNEVMRLPVNQKPAQPEAPPPPEPGTVESALKRGTLRTAGDFANFGGMAAEALGADEYAQRFYDKAEELNLRASEYKPTIGRVENIQSIGDLATFGVEVLAENAPILASMLIPGGAVTLGARVAGAAPRVASGAGAGAAFLSNVGFQTGESVGIALEAGKSPVDIRVTGAGIGKAALDFVPLITIAKRLGLAKNLPIAQSLERAFVGEAARGGFVRRAAGNATAIVAREIPTEVMQEIINISLDRTLKEYEGDLTEEEKSQLINAAAGAGVFGVFGIPAAFRTPPDAEPRSPLSDQPAGASNITQVTQPEATPTGARGPEPTPGPATQTEVGDIPVDTKVELPAEEGANAEPQQRTAAKQAQVEEPAQRDNQTLYIDEEGELRDEKSRDPMLDVEPGNDPISRGLQLTAAQLEVASRFPAYTNVSPASDEGRVIAAMNPTLQKLYELKSEVESDPESYRTTDGLLKNNVQNKLEKLNIRIEKLEEQLGLIGPKPTIEKEADSTVARILGETGTKPLTEQSITDETVSNPEPQLVEMTERQKAQLLSLEEASQTRELSPAEWDRYTELMEIASGERASETRAPTAAESAQLLADAREGFRADAAGQTELAARGEARAPGLKPDFAQRALEAFTSNFQYGPAIRIYTNQHPDVVSRAQRWGGAPRGWFNPKEPGIVNIVADNNTSLKELYQTYAHETMVHYGLRAFMTQDERLDLLRSMLKDPPPGFTRDAMRPYLTKDGVATDGFTLIEEYVAKTAEEVSIDPNSGLVEMTWWKRLVALLRRKLRQWGRRVKWSQNDIAFMLRDISKHLTGQITTRYSPDQRPYFKEDSEMASLLGDNMATTANSNISSLASVWGVRFNKMFLTPLQFASKYRVPGSQAFLEYVQQWWARKRVLTDYPTILTERFRNQSASSQQKLSRAILEISIKSDEKGRRLTQEEIQDVFRDIGMQDDAKLIEIWQEMDKSFRDVVTQLRVGLETNVIRINGKVDVEGNPVAGLRSRDESVSIQRRWAKARAGTSEDRKKMLQELGFRLYDRLLDVDKEMKQLEDRNYFPRMRFGQWAIAIRATKDVTVDGTSYKGPTSDSRGEMVYFETFESLAAQQEAFKDLEKKYGTPSYSMRAGKLTDQEFHFMGTMSPQLYEHLLGIIPPPRNPKEAELTQDVKDALKEVYLKNAPGRSFLRHLTKRKGVAGYSEDVLRVYASYMMNVANHIARVEYHLDMNEQLQVIRDTAAQVTPDGRVADVVTEYFQEQFNYLMNPENDWAQIRAVGFLWYLGFNVKSAMVNLTQVPMVALPYLSSKHGTARSTAAITKAYKMVFASKAGRLMPAEYREAIARGVREGFIEESHATELAGLSESSTLQRMIPQTEAGRILANTSYYGAFLFQKAERINREVTFLAAYMLGQKSGVRNKEQLFRVGRDAVQTAMFEYSKWNRAKFMRGKKSVFFLFWQYMQGLSYLAFGGKGAKTASRIWLMLLVAGGLQGLPFAENIMDLLNAGGTKVYQALGIKNPRVDLREDIRQLANQLTDRPDLVMHGLSRVWGLGPIHLAQMFGMPVPELDISGSISAGRVLPGTQDFFGPERDPSAKLGRTLVEVAGPVAGIPYQIWRTLVDTNPDTWKVWERALPTALKNVSSAVRRGYKGEESYRGGGAVAQFDIHDTEHRAELIFNALGFGSTRLNQRYEADFAVQNLKQYWTLRRSLIMENVAIARMGGDPDAIQDAIKALHRFNDSVPHPTLRIRGDQLLQSVKQRFRRASLREQGLPSELLFRSIARTMRELYPEAAVDIQ